MNKTTPQSGYVLITVIVLLAGLLVIATQFMGRSAQSMQITGYDRDAAESLQLSESAMNWAGSQFALGGSLDGDNIADNLISFDPANAVITLPYVYFVSNTTAINSTVPGLLQRVADGQSQNQGGTVTGARVSVAPDTLRIADLTSQGATPIVFEEGNAGLRQVTNRTFDNIRSPRRAAFWIELVLSAGTGDIDIYAQSVGRVGNSTSYTQRYIGHWSNTLGFRPVVTQAG